MPSEPLILVYVYSCILAVGELTSLGSVYSSQDKYRPASDPRPPKPPPTQMGASNMQSTGGEGEERRTTTGECFTDMWPPLTWLLNTFYWGRNHVKIGSWSLGERAPRQWISHVACFTHDFKVSWFSKTFNGKCVWLARHPWSLIGLNNTMYSDRSLPRSLCL